MNESNFQSLHEKVVSNIHTFPRLEMGCGRLSQDPDLSSHDLKFKGILTRWLGTIPFPTQANLGIAATLFLGGVVPVVLGHKFSFLFFNGDTTEVRDFFNGELESVFTETFLSIAYTISFIKL